MRKLVLFLGIIMLIGITIFLSTRVRTPRPVVNDNEQSHTAVTLSADKKNIMTNNSILISIDDTAIVNFFRTKSQLCDDSNITTTLDRKKFCQDSVTLKKETKFSSIVVSPDNTVVGFTIESTTLSPDTVAGIFYPYRTENKMYFLTNYYLGNQFLSFSPEGNNFVFKHACFEGVCGFSIMDSKTLEIKLEYIPEEETKGSYIFERWLTDSEIEYQHNSDILKAEIATPKSRVYVQ